jgi:hypothetical protein
VLLWVADYRKEFLTGADHKAWRRWRLAIALVPTLMSGLEQAHELELLLGVRGRAGDDELLRVAERARELVAIHRLVANQKHLGAHAISLGMGLVVEAIELRRITGGRTSGRRWHRRSSDAIFTYPFAAQFVGPSTYDLEIIRGRSLRAGSSPCAGHGTSFGPQASPSSSR